MHNMGNVERLIRNTLATSPLPCIMDKTLGPVDCLLKDHGSMSGTFYLCETSGMEVSSLLCVKHLT